MLKVTFIEHNGTAHTVEGAAGKSVMQTALDHLVPGIVGDCGGCCSCATCHGYVDPTWLDKLAPIKPDEAMMLEGALNVETNSRLTCQIALTPELDGIVIRLPESQY